MLYPGLIPVLSLLYPEEGPNASVRSDAQLTGAIDQAVVESGAMAAASSIVPPRKVVKKGELWAGVPAKLLRSLKQEEIDYIKTSENNYVKLGQEHLELCRQHG